MARVQILASYRQQIGVNWCHAGTPWLRIANTTALIPFGATSCTSLHQPYTRLHSMLTRAIPAGIYLMNLDPVLLVRSSEASKRDE